ncbi:MAG: calcium-binding protein, partial [Rhizobiaceae bacterium]
MARHIFHGRISETIEIDTGGQTWHVARDARISVEGTDGIHVLDGVDNSTIVVEGRIKTDDYGLYLGGSGDVVTIGKTAVISGVGGSLYCGVWSNGNNLDFTNHGQIIGGLFGIFNAGFEQTIVNAGLVEASDYGIAIQGDASTLLNASGATIKSSGIGVKLISREGDRETVTNHGLIKAGPQGMSIYGADGTDIVYSDGRLVGDVVLAGGGDILDLRGGTMKGSYFGGSGNDVLITDSARHRLVETPNAGEDIVGSSVTYRLPENVETLILIGHGDIDGFGNAVANNLKGSGGDNRLEGGGGMDYFKSGKGDDVLVGGTESDLFYFAKHHDDDTIIDFQTGLDVIKLVDWIPAQGFDDIMA